MQQNVGRVDAWIRGVLAVGFLLIAVIFNEMPLLSLGAAVVALVLIGTALTRSCPLYRALDIVTARDTRKTSSR